MYANRYQSGSVNPGSLSLSVGLVGGLMTVAMLSVTVITHEPTPDPLPIFTVTPPPPPPPQTPEKPVEAAKPVPPTTVTEPTVVTPAEPDRPVVAQPDPGPPTTIVGTGEGGGGGGAVVDPPKPPLPVLTRADIDPRYLRDFQPAYPPAEQRAGNEGVVSLRVLIGIDGRVRQVERLASPSDAFWRATEQRALSRWRFTPATRDGIPYESWKAMTVRFRISEA